MLQVFRHRRQILVGGALVAVAMSAVLVHAQRRFEVFLLAVNNDGRVVTDLKATDLRYRENEQVGDIVSIEPYKWPVKVTVLVDNGLGGASGLGGATQRSLNGSTPGEVSGGSVRFDESVHSNLVQFRSGLKKFFDVLPRDVEVTLITTAPNPRYLVRPTTDQIQIQKGVGLIVNDDETLGRFTDSLTEYTERLDRDFKGLTREQRPPYLPVLVSIGSAGLDGGFIEKERTERMLLALQKYGVMTYFIMVTPGIRSDVPENEGGTVLIAKAAQQMTGGRYDAIASSATSRLTTLLPEIAGALAVRHVKQTWQYRVLIDRPEGLTGPFSKDLAFSLSRENVKFVLSLDGSYP